MGGHIRKGGGTTVKTSKLYLLSSSYKNIYIYICRHIYIYKDQARAPRALWALVGPWDVVGRALVGPWALLGSPGPLWAGTLWAPWALVGPPGPLWAGPLWAPGALVGQALVGALGLCGPPWALVGQALVGPMGPCGPPWALAGQVLVGRALVDPPGPSWAGP